VEAGGKLSFQKTTKAAEKTTRTVKFKTNVRGLDVVQSVYAFAMALGLTSVFTGSQEYVTKIFSGTAALADEKTILVGLMLANVIMLGLRFFWVPRNLQGLVIAAARILASAPKRDRALYLPDYIIAYHLVLILMHGALFYLLCGEFEFVVFSVSFNRPMSSADFVSYIIMHVLLLLLNAVWIALIKRQEDRLKTHLSAPASVSRQISAGDVWWRNNLICSLVALSPFAISSTCKSVGVECVRDSLGNATDLTALFPTSPQVLATVYYDLVGSLGRLGLTSPFMAVYWVFFVLIVNSGYDLLHAGRSYVFFEDVEWEESIENPDIEIPLGRQ
jgi:hypothetical protein